MSYKKLNENCKNLISEIDNLKIDLTNQKNTIDSTFTEIQSDITQQKNEIKSKFDTYKSETNKNIKDHTDDFATTKQEIETYKTAKNAEIDSIKQDIETKKSELDEYYGKLFHEDNCIQDQINKIQIEIENYKNKLLGKDETEGLKQKIETIYKDLSNVKNDIFGTKITDKETGDITETNGLLTDVKELITEYETQLEKLKKDSAELISTKSAEIDNVLSDKKIEMNALLDKMGLDAETVAKQALSEAMSNRAKDKKNSAFWTLISLIGLAILTVLSIILSFKYINIKDADDLTLTMIRISFGSPFILIGLLQSRKYNRDISLEDQLSYKATIMATYNSISNHMKHSESIQNYEAVEFGLLQKTFDKILENEADKADNKNEINMKYLDKAFDKIASSFNVTRKNLLDAICSGIGTLKEKQKTKSVEKYEDNKQEQTEEQ